MSKSKAPSFDDLDPVEDSNDSDDAQDLELEPGDEFVGEVRSIERNLGDFDSTLVHFATEELGEQRKYWLPNHVDAQFYQADIQEGDVIGLSKAEEPTETETEEGDTVEYHRVEVRV